MTTKKAPQAQDTAKKAGKASKTKEGQDTEQAATETKSEKAARAKRVPKARKLSAINAAAQVLAETGRPMSCRELIEAMAAKGYWSSPNGQTPAATLYAAILREMKTRGAEARFRKVERGKFAANQVG